MADEGSGATLTFGTTGVSLDLLTIQGTGVSREALETTNLGTNTAQTFMPSDLYDPGEIAITFQYNPNTQPPFSNAAETITITAPVPSGNTNGATAASSGFVTNFDEGQMETGAIMVGSATIKRTGAITYADAS